MKYSVTIRFLKIHIINTCGFYLQCLWRTSLRYLLTSGNPMFYQRRTSHKNIPRKGGADLKTIDATQDARPFIGIRSLPRKSVVFIQCRLLDDPTKLLFIGASHVSTLWLIIALDILPKFRLNKKKTHVIRLISN